MSLQVAIQQIQIPGFWGQQTPRQKAYFSKPFGKKGRVMVESV